MPESTQGKEGNKIPEKSIFPVSKESVDRTLEEITQDPTRAMSREQALMRRQNPMLFANLDDFGKKLGDAEYFDLMGGACWTYRILRMQAETCERELPQISPDLLRTYIHDEIQYANERSEKKEFVPFEERVKKIATQDPEFGRAIKEFTKYRVTASGFFSGAIEVYDLIKNALQSEELEKRFNSKPTSEEPIGQVLGKLLAERKPLSEEEAKEAVAAGREVWRKAMEKAEGKKYASLWHETPDTREHITLYTDEKIAMHKPENPNTDLVIMTSKEVRGKEGEMIATRIVHKYFFAPDEVTKTTFDLTGTKDINFGKLDINIGVDNEGKFQDVHAHAQMSDLNLIRKQAERQMEQRIEETYHPDKADLSNLLAAISSAK